MSNTLIANDLRPDQEAIADATVRAFKGRVDEDEVRRFLKAAAETPAPIGATASLKLAVWGKLYVSCEADGRKCVYDQTAWGGPAYFGDSVGFMYTAYDSWAAFFANVTGFHVQGIAEGGGILQVNWFIANGTPVGQFNGVAGGIGAVEAGGSGGWQCG
jgi:hypothetical protein